MFDMQAGYFIKQTISWYGYQSLIEEVSQAQIFDILLPTCIDVYESNQLIVWRVRISKAYV